MKENFVIDNLETVLLTENSLTKFLKDYQIEFNKKEDGIDVFYNGKKCQFKGSENARLRNRLCKLNDSCVNGFLFNEKMDYMYIGLTGMPEIFSDLMNSLGRRDLKQEYLKRRKSYEVTIKVPIDDLIFDDDSQIQNCSEKTKLILKYVTNYLCYKMSKGKCYCFNNPIKLFNLPFKNFFSIFYTTNCMYIFIIYILIIWQSNNRIVETRIFEKKKKL